MGVQVGFMGVRVGSAGRQAWFWPLSDSGPAAALNGRQRFCTSDGIRPVRLLEINIGAVAYRAMWGYGVDPPSAWNPHHGPDAGHVVGTRATREVSRRPECAAPARSPRILLMWRKASCRV